MDADTRLLRSFLVVAEELHFGRAAARLHITQQALSLQIRKLEGQLGVVLLNRSSRRTELTAQGELFLPTVRTALAALDDGARALVQGRDRLRVARVPGGGGLPSSLVRRLRAARPEVSVQVGCLSSSEQVEAVAAGELDVAFAHVSGPVAAGLSTELIRLEPVLFAARAPVAPAAEPAPVLQVSSPRFGRYRGWARFLRAYAEAVGLDVEEHDVEGGWLLAELLGPGQVFATLRDDVTGLLDRGFTVWPPPRLQPYYAWSLVWRRTDDSPAARAFRVAARSLAEEEKWDRPDPTLPGVPWRPPDERQPTRPG